MTGTRSDVGFVPYADVLLGLKSKEPLEKPGADPKNSARSHSHDPDAQWWNKPTYTGTSTKHNGATAFPRNSKTYQQIAGQIQPLPAELAAGVG